MKPFVFLSLTQTFVFDETCVQRRACLACSYDLPLSSLINDAVNSVRVFA